MNQVTLQLILAVSMFITTVAVGLLPLKLQRLQADKPGQKKKARLFSLLSCFAGGVFLGTSFLDIFPHVNENYIRVRERMNLGWSYPFPELFICLGFFLTYLLEEVTLKVFGSHGHEHGEEKKNLPSAPNYRDVVESEKLTSAKHDGEIEEHPAENGRLSRNSLHASSHLHVANTHELFVEEYANAQSSADDEGGLLRSITFAAAISFHSILEGFALGIQENITGIVTLFISLLFDKGIEAFSVGLQISKSNRKRVVFVVITIITYALMTPVGAMIGVALQEVEMDPNVKDAVMIALEGLAGGTFVYITFFEVLSQERENDVSNLYQLAAIVGGFSVIASLQVNEHFNGD